ncbi:MAG TPA: hypothetical protein VHB21_11725, partial [Minicystis sp.]|nr:hypothetical protein [Minicystis sp.]
AAALVAKADAAVAKAEKAERARADKPGVARRRAGALTLRLGVVAFLVAALFVAIGWGAGYLLTAGALELLARGEALPVPLPADRIPLVLPGAVALFGALPGILLYRSGTFARALGVAALAAVGGYAAFLVPGGALVATLELQATAFGVAGYLAAALVLGVLGGSRLKPPAPPPSMGIRRDA